MNTKKADSGQTSDAAIDKESRPSLDTVDGLVGCPVCGGKLTKIRGKHPGDPQREVCPTCLAERMDMIRDMSDPHYGVACAANAELHSSECSEAERR